MIFNIIKELRADNSSKYKQQVLSKYKDNQLFQRVLKLTLSSEYDYNISLKTVNKMNLSVIKYNISQPLEYGLDKLELLYTRQIAKHVEKEQLIRDMYINLSDDKFEVIKLIIDRDLDCGIGTRLVQKVFGTNLIYTPPYMRCGTYSEKAVKKIKFPALIQVKADGTFRSVVKSTDSVTFITRSGEISQYPELAKIFLDMQDGVYIGEMLIEGIENRAEANGLLNSLDVPQDKVYMQLWDYISLDDWKNGESILPYRYRLDILKRITPHMISKVQVIPTFEVNSIQEALKKTSEFMSAGFEGSILKDYDTLFKNHTSPTQLKLKIKIETSVRITGFTEGTAGTKREEYFGAITFETDDGMVKGQTSGFTDQQMKDFSDIRDSLIGQIIDVEFNDITKGKNNNYYALLHPRFLNIRSDIDKTDTIERIFELREMALQLDSKC